MSLRLLVTYPPGRTIFATVRQQPPNGTLVNHWNNTTNQWVPAAAMADRKVPLNETDSGAYNGGISVPLEAYTGQTAIWIHDQDLSDEVVGSGNAWLEVGDEADYATSNEVAALPLATHTEFENQGGVTSSNMRGTDDAFLAVNWIPPDNANIVISANAAVAAQAASESVDGKLTATRALYLDNLQQGLVATQASVDAITNSVRIKLSTAAQALIPDAGTSAYTCDVLIYAQDGSNTDPDADPTLTASNEFGANRSFNLSTMTKISVGHYRWFYNVASTHAEETINFLASAVEGGLPLSITSVMPVVAVGAGTTGFQPSDRAKLDGIFDKLPTQAYLTGTTAADGDVNLDTADGDRTQFHADVSALATSTEVTGIPLATHVEFEAQGGVTSSNMRGTDDAFLAADWIAPDNVSIIAARDASESVDAKLTNQRALNLDFLDVAVSTRSTFDVTTEGVTLAPGQGLATEAQLNLVQAKTDLIPPNPTDVTDIPTAGEIASQTDATLTISHGAGMWDAVSDATEANQLAILAQLGAVVPSPVSPVMVSAQRTWTILAGNESDRAPEIVTLDQATVATLAMNFSAWINPETSIAQVNTVTDLSGLGLVADELIPSQDGFSAHFNVSGLTSGDRHELKVTVTTTDGQVLTGRGVLQVR